MIITDYHSDKIIEELWKYNTTSIVHFMIEDHHEMPIAKMLKVDTNSLYADTELGLIRLEEISGLAKSRYDNDVIKFIICLMESYEMELSLVSQVQDANSISVVEYHTDFVFGKCICEKEYGIIAKLSKEGTVIDMTAYHCDCAPLFSLISEKDINEFVTNEVATGKYKDDGRKLRSMLDNKVWEDLCIDELKGGEL